MSNPDSAIARDGSGRLHSGRRRTDPDRSSEVVVQLPQTKSVVAEDVDADVAGALRELPQDERRIVDLRFLHGREVDEIAAEMGISSWMVRRRLQVAVARLRVDSLAR